MAVQLPAGAGVVVLPVFSSFEFSYSGDTYRNAPRTPNGGRAGAWGGDRPLKRGFPMKIMLKDQLMGADAPIPHL
jgi:hypothetical protein